MCSESDKQKNSNTEKKDTDLEIRYDIFPELEVEVD